MNISFKEMDYSDSSFFQLMEKWHNDPEIRKNYLINFTEADTTKYIHADDIQQRLSKDKLTRFVIYDEDKAIGEFNYHTAHPEQVLKNSLWVGISVSDAAYRGKGVARLIMSELEKMAMKMNLYTIEIGVYAFNERAISFYQKLGYQTFDKVDDFCFWEGKKWPFLRMKKNIQ